MDDWERPELYAPGILTGRVNEDTIRLGVLGGDWQIEEIGKHIKGDSRKLTVSPKKTGDGTGELSVPLTWAMVTQCARIAQKYEFKWQPDEELCLWITEEFERRFAEFGTPDDLRMDLTALDRTPMPHQMSGAFTGAMNKRFFFGDAAGTGKTMTALLTLAELEAQGLDPFPAFVVTPASVVTPWLEELQACFPDWTFTDYRGPRRSKLSSRYQVYVMSWHTFRDDMQQPEISECDLQHLSGWNRKLQKQLDQAVMAPESFKRPVCAQCGTPLTPADNKNALPPLVDFVVPRTVILDEAHALCNVKTKQSVAAMRIARVARYVFPMSGTPITKDVSGFWRAMSIIDVRSFPDQDRYQARYTDRFVRDYGRPEIEGLTTANRQEFYTLMQGTMRYVSKKEVLPDLPDKTYSTRIVQLPPAYRKAYNEMEEDMIAHLPDTDEPLPVMTTLAQMQRLSQLASSACDVEIEMVLDAKPDSLTFGEMIPHYKVTPREPCWKVDELMALMAESVGDPIITFSPHTQLVNIAGARAESQGYRVGYIKGGQTHKQRDKTRIAFQAGELDLLCANTAAGGVGLTLTASRNVVFLERPWAFWQADQAEDRVHRRGTTGQVSITDIVAANTIESRVREALKDKAQSLSDLVRDPSIVRGFLGGQKIRVS